MHFATGLLTRAREALTTRDITRFASSEILLSS